MGFGGFTEVKAGCVRRGRGEDREDVVKVERWVVRVRVAMTGDGSRRWESL